MKFFATAGTFLLAAVFVGGFARESVADCPNANLLWQCGSDAGVPSMLPAAASTGSSVEVWTVGQPCLEGCYDIPNGGLEAKGFGDRWSPACGTGAWMKDDYWIAGPPSAEPFNFEAVLTADVTITDSYSVRGTIWTDGALPEFTTIASGTQTIAASLTKSVGEVFALQTNLGTSGSGSDEWTGAAHATATLRFRGLPKGYSIVSCQGYDLPVPARPTPWGEVKALYR
jgi:hypothetical protein